MVYKMPGTLTVSYNGRVPTLSWSSYIPFPALYYVDWAPGSEGPWERLTVDGVVVAQYTDSGHQWTSINRVYWRVMALVGGVEVEHVSPTVWVPMPRVEAVGRYLQEIVRRHRDILLDKFAGESCSLYLRRSAGVPCRNGCSVGDAHVMKYPGKLCQVCFNTGIEGGYVKLENQLIRVRNAQTEVELRQDGVAFTEGRTAWLGPAPLVFTGDWFIRPTGERFAFTNVRRRELQGYVTLQVGSIKEIEPQHPLYDITDNLI